MIISREFKFRHANEVAGVFVILAFVLLAAGVFFTGRSQGWFAQRITLFMEFDTPEGTFGLQEGAAVQVRNTTAGRVAVLEPTEDGKIQAVLRIREQYRRFITVDATARIKRTFGVAGDAFVEIVPGTGALIEEGGKLAVVKDEELLEMAQRILEELQGSVAPIFMHVETIISNTASILMQVEQGQGVVGALIADTELRDHTKGVVAQAEGVTQDARGLFGQTASLLDNQVLAIAERTVSVQRELERTLSESRKVVEAFQRHWLIRRYVEKDDQHFPLLPGGPFFDADDTVLTDLTEELAAARLKDDARAVVRAAYNLAVYALATDQREQAEALLHESLVAARRLREIPAEVRLLQAELLRLQDQGTSARASLDAALALALSEGRRGRSLVAYVRLQLADLALAAGDLDEAAAQVRQIRRMRGGVLEDSVVAASLLGIEAQQAMQEGRLDVAASLYIEQAAKLRDHAAYGPMANALLRAAELYFRAGEVAEATETYIRAAASFAAQQQDEQMRSVLVRAVEAAVASGDELLIRRVADLRTQLGD
jgi:hypothetical protein